MRKIKVIFSVLAMSLCFALQPVNTKAADTTTEVTPTATTEGTETVPDSVIHPYSLVTGEEDITNIPSYDIVVPLSTKSLVVPIQMDYKGQLRINFAGKTISKGVDIYLYSDEACTTQIGYYSYISSSSLNDDKKYDIPEKTTCYLKFKLSTYAETDATITITPYSFTSESKVMKEKVWISSHPYTGENQTIHKIIISKPGYIKIESAFFEDSGSMNATLCNSKKEALTEPKYLYDSNNHTTYYAVKKGTYYINIKTSADYKLRYTFSAVKDTSGQSQKKAKVIGKGKTVKGLILSEDSLKKVDWYQVKLTKSQKLVLNINVKSCDNINFAIVPASSKVFLFGSSFNIYDVTEDTYGTKSDLPAGTYYIKVTKTDVTSSGYYSIKLK